MKIHHIAIWAYDLELLKDFYLRYFDMECGNKYVNPAKNFSSYFLKFKNGGASIEIMHKPGLSKRNNESPDYMGLAHFSISLGSKEAVNQLTRKLQNAGYSVVEPPRTTGDGYYESVVKDPEGNTVELTV